VAAIPPFERKGGPRLWLSLAAYSFRDTFNHADPAQRITLFDFLDFCADHGCVGAEVTSYYFPREITPEFLLQLKRHAFLRGLALSGTAVGNDFTLSPGSERDAELAKVRQWIDYAAILGAPHIRVFAGAGKGLPKEEAKRLTIAALEECGDYAARKGVWLGLENHGGIVAQVDDLLDIIRAVKSPWCGVNLDSGNFYSKQDPYEEMARLAPYAVNVQLKVEVPTPAGGRVPTDARKLAAVLRRAGYQGYVALEYESKDPWTQVPVWLKRMQEALRE
jgi:sugar phosphate isomerase/epimerase